MKHLIWSVYLVAFASGVGAATQYRDFTSAEGKTIRGAVVAYDVRTKTVTIERDNKRTSKVPITVFSEADQTYILEWDASKGFSSESLLKISCEKKRVNQHKEKVFANITYENGDVENELSKETSFESIVFETAIYSMNASDLNDIRMEYIVYYEQSEESLEKPVVEQKSLAEKISIPLIESRKKTTVATKPVEIYKDNVVFNNFMSGMVRTGGEGEVHGLRARLYMKMPSGTELMREFCFPDKLSEKEFPWKD